MGENDFSFSYSYGTYDAFSGFNSIGGSGYAGQNVTYQGTNATGFDAFTSNPFVTNTTTTGFTFDTSVVGSANYQIGVDYTNNAVTGFANPNTGGTQALSLDNTYYTISSGSDEYLTSQFNAAGSIAEIQTLTATVIANTQGVDGTYSIIDTIDETILTRADDGQSLNVPLSVSQLNVQIITAESTTVADSSVSASAATTVTALTPVAVSAGAVSTFDANTLFEQAVVYNTTVTLTNAEVLEILQENIDAAVSLRSEVLADSEIDPNTFTIRDGDINSSTYGQIVTTTAAVEAVIDAAYATYDAFKDNPQAFVELIRAPALTALEELLIDVAGGVRAVDIDFVRIDGQVNSTTVDTTGATVGKGLIVSLAETPTDTTLPTIDEGDTEIQTVEVTANTSVSKAIRDSLGLENQGPILEKLISKAIDLALNQIPGYREVNSAIGTVNKIVRIGDIVTNVSATPAETALALARLLIPQVNLVVTGFNLVTGEGGGGGGGVEALEPIPVNTTVDVQAGGASEEEIPPGSIDFGPAAVTSEQDPQAVPATTESTTAAFQDANLTAIAPVGNFAVAYNVETGTYDVYNLDTNEIVAGGFTQEQATEYADALNVGDDFEALNVQSRADAEARFNEGPADVTITQDPSLYPNGLPYDDDGNLNPGWAINPDTNEPYFIGGDYIDPSTIASANASREAFIQSQTKNAQAQAAIQAQRKQANEGDWRVKLRLAGSANYLYKDPEMNQDGILWPLNVSDGVVFPYTPQIQTTYGANYNAYDLTHSNYRGYFYQNSYVDEIQIQATFTAQDTSEANYMLAVIHFFKSVTKMFYGQDAQRGMPPPLVFLQGLGEFQFNLHPCVVKSFNYQLPNNVDYIRARSVSVDGTNLLKRRDRQTLSTSPSLLQLQRLMGAGLQTGALTSPQAPPTLGTNNPTYVPTKIDISLGLLPIQSRSQVSKQFSVKQFANGDLLKGGFW